MNNLKLFKKEDKKMNNSLNNQPSIKPDPKGKAIASLILGIISLTAGLSGFFPRLPFSIWSLTEEFEEFVVYCFIFIFIAIISLILGIIALVKSTKKEFAIAGIIFSVVALVIWMGLLLLFIGLITAL